MSERELIDAVLVWDGSTVSVPPQLGSPKEGQLVGSELEKLAELAGRTCYDSLGKGRLSGAYHEHILDIRHLSVYEHCVLTVEFGPPPEAWLPGGEFDATARAALVFLNRPNVFITFDEKMRYMRATLDLRHILEWQRVSKQLYEDRVMPYDAQINNKLVLAMLSVCPWLDRLVNTQHIPGSSLLRYEYQGPRPIPEGEDRLHARIVEPESDDQRWISLFLTGSRGMSHEQVRHGDWTAISQRSTRFVDESESPWVEHPLITAYAAAGNVTDGYHTLDYVDECGDRLSSLAQDVYKTTAKRLEAWLLGRGIDKQAALKQSRGAARGYLGNALYTELIFSASVRQWRWMLHERGAQPADAEIRAMYVRVLRELKRSRYSSSFADLSTALSPDGIGEIVVGWQDE